jgi:hypothetical protein
MAEREYLDWFGYDEPPRDLVEGSLPRAQIYRPVLKGPYV